MDAFSTYGQRELQDGRIVVVYPLTFGRARLTVSTPKSFAAGYYDDAF